MQDVHDQRSVRGFLRAILLVLMVFTGFLRAQNPPSPTEPAKPVSEPGSGKGEVIFLTGDAVKLIKQLPAEPGMVLLSKEKYLDLLKQLETFQKRQSNSTLLDVPYSTVTGKVTGDAVEVVVTLELSVEQKEGYVLLGHRRSEPTSVQLDEETPLLVKDSRGLLLKIQPRPEKKQRQIKLTLKARIEEQKAGLNKELREGFEIDLPEVVASTSLENLQLPANVLDVQINGEPPDTVKGNLVSRRLGSVSTLKVSWLKRTVPGQTSPMRTVLGTINAWIDSGHLTTKASLVLKSGGQPVKEWQLYVPAGAKVELSKENQGKGIQVTREKARSKTALYRITLPKAESESLSLIVTDRQPIEKGVLPPLGPFTVLGAASQRGTIRFHGASHQWVHCSSSQAGRSFYVEVLRRKPTSAEILNDPSLISIFDYWAEALAGDQSDVTSTWLTPRLSHARGRARATLNHVITLAILEDGRPEWRLKTTIDVEPVQLGVDRLTLSLPLPWELRAPEGLRPQELISSSIAEGRNLSIRLIEEQKELFTLTLEAAFVGDAPLARGNPITLPLPQLPKEIAWDRGHHNVQINAPDTIELLENTTEDPDLKIQSQKPHQMTWAPTHFPENVSFRWRPWRPQQQVNSIVDVVIHKHHAVVTQEWLYPSDGSFPNEVAVQVPRACFELGPPKVLSGMALNETNGEDPAPAERILRFRPVVEATQQRSRLELEYAFELPEDSEGVPASDLNVPLIRAARATHGWIRARAWAGAGSRLSAREKGWKAQPLEQSSRESALPQWVGEASSPSAPLTLLMSRAANVSPIMIERVLYQVRLLEGDLQKHQARFRIATDGQSPIFLELPASPSALRLQFFLDDQPAPWKPASGGQRNVIEVPPLNNGSGSSQTQVLMVQCQMTSTRDRRAGLFQTSIHPVVVISNEAPYPVRWQIDLAEDQTAITWTGSEQDSWKWSLQGLLLTPVPLQRSVDLERWFAGELDSVPESTPTGRPSIVSASSRLHPLTITHVPQQGWLMVCSLGVLALGLALYFVPLGKSEGSSRNRYFWPMVTVVCLTAAGASLLYPRLLASIAQGAQPGLVVLILTLVLHWLWQGRRSRRVMMMPGFRQGKRPSGSGPRPEGEGASTTSHVPISSLRNSSANRRRESSVDPSQTVSPPSEEQEEAHS